MRRIVLNARVRRNLVLRKLPVENQVTSCCGSVNADRQDHGGGLTIICSRVRRWYYLLWPHRRVLHHWLEPCEIANHSVAQFPDNVQLLLKCNWATVNRFSENLHCPLKKNRSNHREIHDCTLILV